ncbi:hypothetical protein SCP_0205460 [Sparassis crispa]|uniref:Zona occludens toxin N-terminal domain-containing protein n=1 Tax=Sparassis crispa TaxID=139825 RepID=A0A401GB01_9APHY|nr:hypothetical protein SCP_0205460 [Sparassis crispa]GBE79348.1 hypothetical protein SCP_0205460 [Sparassis crispa]
MAGQWYSKRTISREEPSVSLPSPVSTRTASPEDVNPLSAEDALIPAALEELELLGLAGSHLTLGEDHEHKTAPLITREAYLLTEPTHRPSQYGVLGAALSVHEQNGKSDSPRDPRLYINTNAPLSAIVCGVQGSGKSHTVSVLLENMLIPRHAPIGNGEKALSGLVLHFGEAGAELDAEAFLSMMAVGSSDSAPLYVQTILSILRDLGEKFTYSKFQRELDDRKFNPAQRAGLEQRMALLKGFIDTKAGHRKKRFAAGQLTIIDLSDPFIDPAAACGLFEIVIRQFVRAHVGTGKVLVVDEAHKYLAANKGNSRLTKALLSLTRQQRHMAMRVLISTQEPTVVPPVLLDLCSVAILHRFSSPSWWDHVAKHVSANLSDEAFDQIVKLRTGEAIVLAPSGLGVFARRDADGAPAARELGQFGRRYLLVKTRQRVTTDGGASVLVV